MNIKLQIAGLMLLLAVALSGCATYGGYGDYGYYDYPYDYGYYGYRYGRHFDHDGFRHFDRDHHEFREHDEHHGERGR